MDNILKKCCGLPLAIVSIANVLAGYKSSGSKEKWETICRSIGSQMESNPTLEGMRHIVTLSYNHLPYELKSCMMYLSIFPEDYEINKDRLLGRWIAEGSVPEKRGLTLMEVAESYELVSRNMVEPRFGFDGKVESCRVHDMLLEVMVCKSLECNSVNLLGGQYAGMSYDRIRRLSIHGDDRKALGTKQPKKKKVGHGIEGMDVEHIRSLSLFQLIGHKLLDHLHRLTLLRVLDLEDCEGLTNEHMRYICRLYLLKFLSLKGTGISEVPPQIAKLEHLQTLDTRGTFLPDLPEAVTNLEKLERIEFRHRTEWYIMWSLPRGLEKMKALCEVNVAVLKNEVQIARELGELQQLQSLSMYIDCRDDNSEIMRARLVGDQLFSVLYKLPNLKSIWMERRCYNSDEIVARSTYTFPVLSSLRVTCDETSLSKIFLFEEGSMTKLETLKVNFTEVERSIAGFEHLPNLKEVELTGNMNNSSLNRALDKAPSPVSSKL
ncbi:disease resistance protein Pik-2-like [Miscanthus floridulus]|uniref:disease resistance protein Pik-2-like n=1 Tax=Miscanthus floridulus TaxID=154761 RepID=UPI003457923E